MPAVSATHDGDAEEDAAAGRDHLAALREPEEERAPVPEHRGRAGDDAGQ